MPVEEINSEHLLFSWLTGSFGFEGSLQIWRIKIFWQRMPWKYNNIPHLWCQWCLFSTVIWSILLTKVHCFVTAGALMRLVNMKPPPSHSDSSGCIRPHRLLLNNVSGVSRRRYAWMFGGRKGGCKARQGKAGGCSAGVKCMSGGQQGGRCQHQQLPYRPNSPPFQHLSLAAHLAKKSLIKEWGASNSTEGGWWCHWSCSPQQPVPHTSWSKQDTPSSQLGAAPATSRAGSNGGCSNASFAAFEAWKKRLGKLSLWIPFLDNNWIFIQILYSISR